MHDPKRMRQRNTFIILLVFMLVTGLCAGCGSAGGAADGNGQEKDAAAEAFPQDKRYSKVAESSDYPDTEDIDDSIYTPVYASELNEGEYLIDAISSTSLFEVADSLLVVSGNSMDVMLRLELGPNIFMYPGTAEEAAADSEDDYITFQKNDAGDQLYLIPVKALDKAENYAFYSRKDEQWYDLKLMLESSSLADEAFKEARYKTVSSLGIDDGTYYIDVELGQETDDEALESPSLLLVQDGAAAAMIVWLSQDLDYMMLNGIRLDAETIDDKSAFIMPVGAFDYPVHVMVHNTSGGGSKETECTLCFDSASISLADPEGEAPYYGNMRIREKIRPEYAKGFTIDAFDNGIYRVKAGKDKYLLVPKMTKLPTGIPDSVTVIRTPVSRVYAASGPAKSFFEKLDVSSSIEFVTQGTDKADVAVNDSRPDEGSVSAPVFVDLSEDEKDEKGKTEWIKIYGLLTGKYGRALRYFNGFCKDTDE